MLSWHVATTKPFCEMIAENGLRNKGFQPFNPKVYTQKIVRGARTWTERPYLPGYIFVRFDPNEDVLWPTINYIRGIQTLLYSASERPAPVKDAAMSILLDRCNGDRVKAEDIDAALSKIVPVGTNVRVVEGPFASFEGKVVWSESYRVKVLLSIFGRSTSALMSSKDVERA